MVELNIRNIDSIKLKCLEVNKIEDCYSILNPTYNFKVLSYNIRSINKNFDNFLVTLHRMNCYFDLIALTECHINEMSIIPIIPGYKSYRSNKIINKNGGVVVYVRDTWNASVHEPNFREADSLLVDIPNMVTLLAIYRSPSFIKVDNFMVDLECYLEMYSKKQNFIMAGDININLLPKENRHIDTEYLCLNAEYGLLPVITIPTRENACLDHIFIKSTKQKIGVVAKTAVTDHYLTMVGVSLKSKSNQGKTFREITKVDYDLIKSELSDIDWSPVYLANDVNAAVEFFTQKLTSIVNNNTRKVRISSSKYNIKPWITPGLIKCMKNRDHLHNKVRRNPLNEILKLTYKRYRNFCNKILKNLKTKYEIEELQKSLNNPKRLWKTIKNICHIPQQRTQSSELLKIPNTSEPISSLNICNDHFATVGQKLADKILDDLNTDEDSLSIQTKMKSTRDSFYVQPTDPTEINAFIMQLQENKAPGIDGIDNKLLKQIKDLILAPLTSIFNKSLSDGEFPDSWKTACVSPIHKNGDKYSPDNYRPISLLGIFSKLLEKIMNKRLMQYLESNNLLSNFQFGFRHNKSTNDATHLLTTKIASYLDRNLSCIGIFIDLAKAFDTISTTVLLKKLEKSGIRGSTLDWFRSYLTDRRQCVRVGNYQSSVKHIRFGVPQGSILGPTLFLLYINDIHELKIPGADIICYADDTAIVFKESNWNEVLKSAEKGMSMVAQWLRSNLLTLNAKKTKFICFHKTRASAPPNTTKTLIVHTCGNVSGSCNCESICKTDSIKYLGVILDHMLNFKEHLSHTSGRVRSTINILRQLRDSAPTDLLRTIYYALCQSLLTYCIDCWGGAAKTYLLEVERAQRSVLKVMLKKPFRYPTDSLYAESQVLSVRQLFVLNQTLKVHKKLNSDEQYTCNLNRRTYFISLPRIKTKFAKRFSPFVEINIYNAVSKKCSLKNLNFNESKWKLKQWLATLCYEKTELLLACLL